MDATARWFSVVLAGDLVNKGPKNAEGIRTAREEGFLAVRGNHDNFALAAATGMGRFSKSFASKMGKGGAKPPPWVKQLSRCVVGFSSRMQSAVSNPGTGILRRFRLGSRGIARGVPFRLEIPALVWTDSRHASGVFWF